MALRATQRQVLVTILAVVLVLFAGCASLPGDTTGESVELGQVTVENSDDTAHTVHVLIERNSNPVYGTTITVDGVSPPTNESDFGGIDTRILTDSAWSNNSGNWTVYTRVGTDTEWQAHLVPTDTDVECYSVRLAVETDASVTGFTPECDSWPPNNST